MTQTEAHKKVLELLNSKVYTQVELSKLVGKSKVTTHYRVQKGDWRKKEINIIENL